jgi:serine/threonine-protein kinase
VLNQRQIEQAIWGGVLVTPNSVYQCITQLRRALGDAARQPQYIQTIPRKGYRLICAVDWHHDVPAVAEPPGTYAVDSAAPVGAATPASAGDSEPSRAAMATLSLPSPAARSKWPIIGTGIGVVLIAAIGIEAKRIADERALAQRERERAAQVSQFMLEVFSAADPFVNLGRPITARELLEQGAQRLDADLNQQPLLRAQVLETIGRSYRRQGLHELAVPALEEALQIRRATSDTLPETGSLHAELGVAFHNLGRFADSDSAFGAALRIRDANVSRPSRQYARLVADLGTLELARSHPHQAVQLLTEGLQLLRRVHDADQQQVAAIMDSLGAAYLWLDDILQAEQSVQAAHQIRSSTLPQLHPDRVLTSYDLGEVLRLQGRIAQAEPLLLAALSAQRKLYGGKGSQVANTLESLALLKHQQDLQQEAEQLAREAIVATRRDGQPDQSGYVQIELARQLMSRKEFTTAERVARSTLEGYRARLPLDSQYVAAAEHFLGEALLGQERLTEAEQVLRSSLGRWRQIDVLGWRRARCISTLGEVLYHQGRITEAEPLLLDAYRTVALDVAADQYAKREIYQRLARFYRQTGRPDALVQLEARSNP